MRKVLNSNRNKFTWETHNTYNNVELGMISPGQGMANDVHGTDFETDDGWKIKLMIWVGGRGQLVENIFLKEWNSDLI